MTLWRLEWLRLTRTRRIAVLGGVYAFFGLLGPVTARYLGEIIDRFGSGDLEVIVPDPVPADGIAQYAGSAGQIGLLVAVVVAAGALTKDAVPEMAIFLRTRVRPVARLLVPRYVVAAGAAGAAYVVGIALAWYETSVLIGGLDVAALLAGTGFAVVYLAFATAVVAAVGARLSSIVATVMASLLVLLLLPVIGVVDTIGRWLPSHLVGAQVALLRDASVTEYLGALAVAVAATTLLLAGAARSLAAREL